MKKKKEENRKKKNNEETANVPVVILNTIVTDDTDEKPMVWNSVIQGAVNKGSIPREWSHHVYIGKSGPNF